MSDNCVWIVGNTTRDPELQFLANGQAVAKFGLAHNTRKKNAAGQWEDGVAEFYNVIAWGSLGENAAESITKGARVIVVGQLKQRSWEADDGTKRSTVELVARYLGPDLIWATAEVKRTERKAAGTREPFPDEGPWA